MDEPLFGERSQKTTVFTFIVGGVVSAFVLFSIIIAIVFGLKEKEHFVIAFALICNFVVLAILYKWYRGGDLDPKFRILIAISVITVLVTGVALNVYVWKKPPAPPPPIQCAGLYRISDGACFPACAVTGYCLDSTLGQCVQIPQCNTTTTTAGGTTGSMFYNM